MKEVRSETGSHERRFAFGANWARFLRRVDEEHIDKAMQSLRNMLEGDSLAGRPFLDIGSGSGLFFLAARRLGASVHSFDYDVESVGCAAELKRLYFADDPQRTAKQESALEPDDIRSLGLFNFVYSWGVLHHTGNMWSALEHASWPITPGGKLFIAINNDTGTQTARWKAIKKTYNRLPGLLRYVFAALVSVPHEVTIALRSLLRLRPQEYFLTWRVPAATCDMSKWHDIIDWVGGCRMR